MNPTLETALPRAFWRRHRLLVVQSHPGHVRLTAVGRARLASAAAREGYAADASIPVAHYEEIARRAIEESDAGHALDLRARIDDESVSLSERELLAQLLGYPPPRSSLPAAQPSPHWVRVKQPATVVSLADWRKLKHAA
ncbi:hypothetical protein [Burkholderia cenocepacia]|uniref:hypothetical protein n=1 Tax=Burkholderia cenocepacia TaxID=95486 RepID=UPI000760C1E1|nr:hypothetical protein [Burkholderia cenocepacia]